MLLLFTFLLIIILISRLIETSSKIPATLSVIVFSFCLYWLFPDLLTISNEDFDEILYLMIPVILLPDILNISVDTLKKHTKEIFYLAVVAVVISILIAMFITPYILPQYTWTAGILLTLFSMLMATDAITVASIMSKFKLPEQLKMYAESESLFNDVTALIIFYFIALPMLQGDSLSIMSVNLTLIKVLILSTLIGSVIAYIGYLAIKILKNPFDQFIIIYLIVITSFLAAEHFHIAGILSIVASVLTFKYFVQKDLSNNKSSINDVNENDLYESIINLIKKVPAITKKEFRGYKKEAMFIGIFANSIVFVILANIIDFSILMKYSQEILIIFLLTTIIRFIAMYSMTATLKLPFRWAQALTFAGTKGALAVIMVHSLPTDFMYKELFESIVYGIVLITTFIYTIFLMIHIQMSQNEYEQDIIKYNVHEEQEEDYTKSLIDMIEKDCVSGALNRQFIEGTLEKEIARVQRYKSDLSVISFKLYNKNINNDIFSTIGNIVQNKIRTNDFFGKLQTNHFIILTANTSISGAIVLANKLYENFDQTTHEKVNFGVTQVEDTDTLESIEERLDDAILRSEQENGERIEVEV